jgi:hypothetical protein
MTSQYYAQYMKYKMKYTNLKMKMRGGADVADVAESVAVESKEQNNTSTRYLVMTEEHFAKLYNKWKQSNISMFSSFGKSSSDKLEEQWSNWGDYESKKAYVSDAQKTEGNDNNKKFTAQEKKCEKFVDYEKKQINMPSYTLIRELFQTSKIKPYTLVINNDTKNEDNQYALYEIASKADIEEEIRKNSDYNAKLEEIRTHEEQIQLMRTSNMNMTKIREFLSVSELGECNTPNQAIKLLGEKLIQLNKDKQTLRRKIISNINSDEKPKLITITNNEKSDGENILATIERDYSIVIKYIKNAIDNDDKCNTVQYIHIETNVYPKSDEKRDMSMAILDRINFDYDKSFEKIVNMIKIHLLIKNIEPNNIKNSKQFYDELTKFNTTELFKARDEQKSANDNKQKQELKDAQDELEKTKKLQQELE